MGEASRRPKGERCDAGPSKGEFPARDTLS